MDVFQHEIDLLREAEGGLRERLSEHSDWPGYEATGEAPAALARDPRFRAWAAIRDATAALRENAEVVKAQAISSTADGFQAEVAAATAFDRDPARHDGPSAGGATGMPEGPADKAHDAVADLTRIRGIDRATARALEAAGVISVAQIAAWRAADVARMSDVLGSGTRIARENWIERAAALVRPDRSHTASPDAAAVPPSIPPATTETAAAPVIEPVAEPVDVPTIELTAIRGVSASLAEQLGALGVSSVADIATWTRADVAHYGSLIGPDHDIAGHNWIEQAALLASGVGTAFLAAQVRTRVPTVLPPSEDAWVPRLVAAARMGTTEDRPSAVTAAETTESAGQLSIDQRIAKLREEVAQIRTLPTFNTETQIRNPGSATAIGGPSDIPPAEVDVRPSSASASPSGDSSPTVRDGSPSDGLVNRLRDAYPTQSDLEGGRAVASDAVAGPASETVSREHDVDPFEADTGDLGETDEAAVKIVAKPSAGPEAATVSAPGERGTPAEPLAHPHPRRVRASTPSIVRAGPVAQDVTGPYREALEEASVQIVPASPVTHASGAYAHRTGKMDVDLTTPTGQPLQDGPEKADAGGQKKPKAGLKRYLDALTGER